MIDTLFHLKKIDMCSLYLCVKSKICRVAAGSSPSRHVAKGRMIQGRKSKNIRYLNFKERDEVHNNPCSTIG